MSLSPSAASDSQEGLRLASASLRTCAASSGSFARIRSAPVRDLQPCNASLCPPLTQCQDVNP
jgi:hypothetical protein